MNQEESKILYHDVLNGYSFYNDNKIAFYIKHFSTKDLNIVNKRKIEIENKAKKIGLLSEEIQLQNLISKDSWSKDKEEEIAKLQDFIKNLKYTKTKLITSRDTEAIGIQLKENESKLNEILKERQEVLGITLESYTNKKINEYYVFVSLYKDEFLKKRLLDSQEFEDLEYDELYELYTKYNMGLSKLNEKNLKKIALSGFFLNSFYLCDDNPYTFFGKPIIDLTFIQTELFAYAKYFKSIITNSSTKIPDNIISDPEALIDWYEGSKNATQAANNMKKKNPEETLGSSFIGASKEDLKKMGMKNTDNISLTEEAKKKGGSLSFQDLIKLHNA